MVKTASVRVSMPPMPEPISTPISLAFSSVTLKPRLGSSLLADCYRVMDEAVHAPQFFGGHVLLGVEITHLTANPARRTGSGRTG